MARTFFIDIDGTIVNNLTIQDLDIVNQDPTYVQELLYGVKHFFASLHESDQVFFTTARREYHRTLTERTLAHHNLKYEKLIMGLPSGSRYVINDTVNVFYKKAIGINVLRDTGFGDTFIFDEEH